MPAVVVFTVDPQAVNPGGPVELLVAAVEASFDRLLVDLAAVEELEERDGGSVGVLLVVLAQRGEVADHSECDVAEGACVLCGQPAALEPGKAADAVANRERAAVRQSRSVAARAGAVRVVVRADEDVDSVADVLRRILFPRAGVHVCAAETPEQQELRAVGELEEQLTAQPPVVAVLGVACRSKDVLEQGVVMVGLERYPAVDPVG